MMIIELINYFELFMMNWWGRAHLHIEMIGDWKTNGENKIVTQLLAEVAKRLEPLLVVLVLV